jgi:hypothetical protein
LFPQVRSFGVATDLFRQRRHESGRGCFQPVLDVAKGGTYEREFVNDPERCEYFVPIRWLQTVPLEKAVKEIGFFGNQNSVCKPTTPKWRATVERLKERFPDYGKT